MTLPRLAVIAERWQRVPPLSVSVSCIAQAMGAKLATPAGGKVVDQAASDGNLDDLVAMMGGTGGFGTELPAWLRDQRAPKT